MNRYTLPRVAALDAKIRITAGKEDTLVTTASGAELVVLAPGDSFDFVVTGHDRDENGNIDFVYWAGHQPYVSRFGEREPL